MRAFKIFLVLIVIMISISSIVTEASEEGVLKQALVIDRGETPPGSGFAIFYIRFTAQTLDGLKHDLYFIYGINQKLPIVGLRYDFKYHLDFLGGQNGKEIKITSNFDKDKVVDDFVRSNN